MKDSFNGGYVQTLPSFWLLRIKGIVSEHSNLRLLQDPLSAFLARHDWDRASQKLMNADSSSRRYYRLKRGDDSAILMVSAPDGSPQATPGHKISDFVSIGMWLRDKGLHAPEIYGADEKAGFLLLEDMGDVSFKQALRDNAAPPRQIYGLAVDVLTHLRHTECDLALPDYYASHVHTGRRRLIDWYMPVALGRKNPDGLVENYLKIWDEIEKQLPPCPQGFLHIDYHVENTMWMPEEQGLRACGILDFQGAMKGPQPYDLANLLEDARLTLSPNIRKDMLDRYCEDMAHGERDLFENWYRVLATQFHCRVIGQFVRLAVRDNRPRYLEHLPRLARYLEEGLDHPLLKPLAEFLKEEGLLLEAPKPAAVVKYGTRHIRPDAF